MLHNIFVSDTSIIIITCHCSPVVLLETLVAPHFNPVSRSVVVSNQLRGFRVSFHLVLILESPNFPRVSTFAPKLLFYHHLNGGLVAAFIALQSISGSLACLVLAYRKACMCDGAYTVDTNSEHAVYY